MKILNALPKFTKVPDLVKAIDPTQSDYSALTINYPLKIKKALQKIFYEGMPISKAAKKHKTSVQLIRYYLNKMHYTKHGGKKYVADKG